MADRENPYGARNVGDDATAFWTLSEKSPYIKEEIRKALPADLFVKSAIFDLQQAVKEVDVHSISALKDLTKAFNSQKKRMDSVEKELRTAETSISDIETALQQNNNELNAVQTIQNKILTEIQNLSSSVTTELSSLDKRFTEETGQLNQAIKDLSGKVGGSSGGSSILPVLGGGAAAAAAAPAVEAAAAKKTLASLVPVAIKGTMRVIGGAVATLMTTVASSLLEATGHPEMAAGADILGDAITGASLGSVIGSIVPGIGTTIGGAVGGVLGAGYGMYEKGGQLLGTAELSPQIKELQQQADERTAAREQDKIAVERLHMERPELANFAGGQPPEVVAPPSGQTPPSSGSFTPSNAFFDSIIKAEGTAKYGDPYNTSLGYMKAPKPLTEMTMKEVLDWGDIVRKAQGLNSSAKGAFQFTNQTQRDAMKALGIGMDEKFTPENQRKMAAWRATVGNGLGAWEGFKLHPDQRLIAQQSMNTGMHHQTAEPVVTPVTPSATTPSTTPQTSSAPEVGRMGGNPQISGAAPMSQASSTGGPPGNDIVGLGKWLQSQGILVSEHPSFGGVNPRKHHPGSAHNDGVAIDINAPGGIVEANNPVWSSKFDKIAAQLQAAGYTVLWKAKDHFDHIHAQIGGKGIKGGHSYIGGQSIDSQSPQAQAQATETPQTPAPPMGPAIGSAGETGRQAQAPIAPPMGAAIGSSAINGMQAQLMGNPLMMMGGMSNIGGIGGMAINMLTPMLMNSLTAGTPNIISGQLQPPAPQPAQLQMPSIGEAPIAPVDTVGTEEAQQQINNINVSGGQSGSSSSTALAQHQVHMNARPDWLGGLAEGLLGATYTGMSRPKYFGAGTGKM